MKVKIDSRKVKNGDIFIAIRGNKYDGHKFIDDAISKGASKIVAEYGNYSVDTLIVDNTKEYLAYILKKMYQDKIKKLNLIGITGTNGKTTTAYLIYQALNKLGISSAYIGTIGFYMHDKVCDLDRTTPDSPDLYEMLLKCEEVGISYIVMEVSSHSLVLERVKNFEFKQAIFTNLTSDHLDYHKTIENYRNAKSMLFRQILYGGEAIINIDDSNADYMIIDSNNNITYGFNASKYQIIDYSYSLDMMSFNYKYNNKTYNVITSLLGKHNVYNLTALIASLNAIKFDLETINDVIPKLVAPSGRLEVIPYRSNKIVIDYAHTSDAVKKVLNTAKEFSKGKIYCIIGCGGDRDASKRPLMAKVALELCDRVILTSDNPRTEDPKKIIDDMILGNEKYNNYDIIISRAGAIKRGISILDSNDTLMILGKGHETYQIIGDNKYHYDDKEEVYKYIKKR